MMSYFDIITTETLKAEYFIFLTGNENKFSQKTHALFLELDLFSRIRVIQSLITGAIFQRV